MVQKLSSRQQAQVAFLERMAPKIPRIYSLVEQLAALTGGIAVIAAAFLALAYPALVYPAPKPQPQLNSV